MTLELVMKYDSPEADKKAETSEFSRLSATGWPEDESSIWPMLESPGRK